MVRRATLLGLRAIRRALRCGLYLANRGLWSLTPASAERAPVIDEDRLRHIREFLLSLDQPDARSHEYLRRHAERLALTVSLAPPSTSSGRCLELGSYMHVAPALQEFCGYGHIRTASFAPKGSTVVKLASSKGRTLLQCEMDLFDAERDEFPYPAEHFELVLAGEMIEHLKRDPMHMLFEIQRVLEPDGRVLITTPNCASIASLEQALWRSSNPYTYSLYPHPERPERDEAASHIREYTPDELRKLMECAGFEIEFLITTPGRRTETKDVIEDLLAVYGFPPDLRGEQMFCLARKAQGAARTRFPSFLYG